MHTRHIMRALPLVADVLGNQYGIQVRIGGDTAYTNGRVICLPSLPVEADETTLRLIRGYLDHEASHIRETAFDVAQEAGLSPLELHVWNILEDWRVEERLSVVFPGCKENLHWLIRHLFLPKEEPEQPKPQGQAKTVVLNWMLLAVRAWAVPEVGQRRDFYASQLDTLLPGIRAMLEPLLCTAPARCNDTASAITLARELIEVMKQYMQAMPEPEPKAEGNVAGHSASNNSASSLPEVRRISAKESLEQLFHATADELPEDMGNILAEQLQRMSVQANGRIAVAEVAPKRVMAFSEAEQTYTRNATRALRTKLQGLLQATRSVRNRCGYRGKLEPAKLHRLSTHNPRVFMQKGHKQGVETAVHILLDASSSMSGMPITLAGQACFAVAEALAHIPGVQTAVSAFPGGRAWSANKKQTHGKTVAPILRFGKKPHTNFSLDAVGSTPMGEALWWALQGMNKRSEPRKLVLLITDGEPDDAWSVQEALKVAASCQVEVYGIGIRLPAISKLLPHNSQVIQGIDDLAPCLFGLLQRALVQHNL